MRLVPLQEDSLRRPRWIRDSDLSALRKSSIGLYLGKRSLHPSIHHDLAGLPLRCLSRRMDLASSRFRTYLGTDPLSPSLSSFRLLFHFTIYHIPLKEDVLNDYNVINRFYPSLKLGLSVRKRESKNLPQTERLSFLPPRKYQLDRVKQSCVRRR